MSSRPPDRRRTRPLRPSRVSAGVALALAAGTGFAVRGLWPGAGAPAPGAAAVPVETAAVTRTDVASEQDVAGTLGFRGSYRVVNELPAGIVTGLPAPGRVLRRGQVLYRLSGQPVLLLYGPVPAWRSFGPGITPGPDVRELQRNLIALGLDPAHEIVPDGILGWATTAAIERWQQARGLTVTGTLPLGQVAFLPGPLRMTAAATPLGTPAATGTTVLTGTSDIPSVALSLIPGGPAVRPGDAVTVAMPSGTTTVPGTVVSVGRVAVTPSSAAQQSGGTPAATIPVTITLGRRRLAAGLDQAPVQVAITQQRDRGVLAVPVTALLARPGGGYAVRVASAPGRLIPVTTGLFDDATGLVEVRGPGLAAGLRVEVAQG
jgi:peptidoglycan hydrolase-like protein with peptidoglycan-binding domain